MNNNISGRSNDLSIDQFDAQEVINELHHYLPSQAPLKDFIHHNTLHSFQHLKFYDAIRNASKIFGYRVTLPLSKFRELYANGEIRKDIFEKIIKERAGAEGPEKLKENLISKEFNTNVNARIGLIRAHWKDDVGIDLDAKVHPILFRILCSYLDQGIAIWDFPILEQGFIESLRTLEKNSYTSFFKTKKAREILLNKDLKIEDLLQIVVGKKELYKQYLFDQQFAHQGWSGMIASVELHPETLLNEKKISLHDLIIFELLLEIDALTDTFGNEWHPLSHSFSEVEEHDILSSVPEDELGKIISIWQDAFEWSFYDQVLAGISGKKHKELGSDKKSFQALFCIDDREYSLRTYIENFDANAETFGTPGFFGVEFYFQPLGGKFYTKLCPEPVTPKYLIKETGVSHKKEKDLLHEKPSHSILGGWLTSQTLGYWSAVKLFINMLFPSNSLAAADSFRHMDKNAKLIIENEGTDKIENGLQIGFTVNEMADRIEALLKSIGLNKDFAPIVYLIGHGASSANNPHFSAYDCGACCGRPGSVNSRVAAFMANHPKVRSILSERGIVIPETTQFVGGLHDTTRDLIDFYDELSLSSNNFSLHSKNIQVFAKALDLNSKERSRRLASIETKQSPEQIHKKIVKRAVSIFEPRPELNHATNTLCIVGGRYLTKKLFLDRRAFLNSYDYRIDLDGSILFNVMKPLGPVCGGINLEYFFSRVDNQKLGAGSKLPHNVMGLFGVANGTDGDLRTGLPSQMIEVHDPIRLLVIVEHFPDVVLNTIKKADAVYEWYINEWVHLVALHPETGETYVFRKGVFEKYVPLMKDLKVIDNVSAMIESSEENLPVCLIN